MTDRQDAIRAAQEHHYMLKAAYEQAENMRQEKETFYPDWSRAVKMRFTGKYNRLLDTIEQIRESLQDAPPEPLHPAEALGKLAEVLQKLIVGHYATVRILQRKLKLPNGWVFGSRSLFIAAIESEWHAHRANEIARAVAEFEGDDLSRWGHAMRVLRHVTDRETRVQLAHNDNRWWERARANARINALNGWLAIRHYAHDYAKLDARVQVWAELQAMEESSE